MKIITMYELLGMVKDGKAPEKIKYRQNIFEFINSLSDYRPNDILKYHGNYLFHYLFEEEVNFLNNEVEILEEKKKIPEKLDTTYMKKIDDGVFISEIFSQAEQKIVDTLNGVIDYLKSKGE